MSIELEILFDEPEPRFFAGGEVRGRVRVHVEKACSCDALLVSLRYRKVAGYTDHKWVVEDIEVFSGEWEPGVHEYPFSIKAPDGPRSFRGHFFDLIWYAHACAELSWKRDPVADCDFELLPRPRPARSKEDFGRAVMAGRDVPPPEDLIPFIAPTLIFAAATVATFAFGVRGDSLCFFFSILFALPTIGMLVAALRRWKKTSPLVDVTFGVAPDLMYPGDEVVSEIAFATTKELLIEEVWCVLVAKEVYFEIPGELYSRKVHEHTKLQDQMTARLELQTGETAHLTGSIRLPSDCVPSIEGVSQYVSWDVSFIIKIEGEEDHSEVQPFSVGMKCYRHEGL